MDLIDRREAMAELYDVFFDDDLKAAYPDKADVVLDVIRKLPSAQPDEKRTEERTETHACDTISRQAAITAMQKAYVDTEGGTDKCAVWKNVGLTNALHIVQDLPSVQPEAQWIPCSERLPEPRTAVLGYAPKYKNIYALYYDSVMGWMVWSPIRDDYFPNSQGEIVAWMPMPEPYEERQEE